MRALEIVRWRPVSLATKSKGHEAPTAIGSGIDHFGIRRPSD
jgi:hypothetical protein